MKMKFCLVIVLILVTALLLPSCSPFRSADNPAATDTGTKTPTEESGTKAPTEESTQSPSESGAESTEANSETESETIVLPAIPVRDPDAPLTVCIDAGHGYTDPGCTSTYLDGRFERDIVAEYAEVLKEKLEEMGYRVILLRDDDVYIDAEKILQTAKELGMSILEDKIVDDGRFAPYNRSVWTNVLHRETYIDLFVSLHIDAFDSMESVRGTRIYYCTETPYSAESEKLCAALSAAVVETLPETNARNFPKAASEAYVVTKHTEMPSVLVEMGFATNPDDAANILSEEWRDSFCDAIARGIMTYAE